MLCVLYVLCVLCVRGMSCYYDVSIDPMLGLGDVEDVEISGCLKIGILRFRVSGFGTSQGFHGSVRRVRRSRVGVGGVRRGSGGAGSP